MKLKWKDFLYFPKNDKNAIILLLFLIVVCGAFAIWGKSFWMEKNAFAQEKALAEFDKFQNGMIPMNIPADEININEADQSKKNKKSTTQLAKLVTGETIELNGATNSTLKRIPGVGDEYAKRILEYRDQLGGFITLEQLREIKGITEKRFVSISPYMVIKKRHKLLKINKLSKNEISKHPYLGEKYADRIIDARQQNGKINNIEDLINRAKFTPRDAERISGYISFD